MTLVWLIVVLVLAAAILAQWRDPTPWRVITFAVFVIVAASLGLDSLGVPKPHWAEWRETRRLILAADFDPPRSIYIWTRGDPPVAYRLPWDEEKAKRIQKGLREAEEQGRPGIWLDGIDYGDRVEHPPPVYKPYTKE